MDLLQLPTKEDPLFEMAVTLDGVPFLFLFDWNSVADRWTLSIQDEAGNQVLSSARLSDGFPMLRSVGALIRPRGELILVSEDGAPVTLNSIENCKFYYLSEEDMEEILG